jgi:hypothetical protein
MATVDTRVEILLSPDAGTDADGWVRIDVVGRMHPQASDSGDGHWLVSPVTLAVGGFTGTVAAGLRVEELVRFREGLEHLVEHRSGTAVLNSMEEWLSLAVVYEPSGVLSVSGAAADQPGIGNTLRFTLPPIEADRLPALVRALRAAEAAYPVLDDPVTED